MGRPDPAVTALLDGLGHPRDAQIRALRAVVLGCREDVVEQVKWDAPSYSLAGLDRVTFRINPSPNVQVVLHHGSAPYPRGSAARRIPDPHGLVRWLAPERGVITISPDADVEMLAPRLRACLEAWLTLP